MSDESYGSGAVGRLGEGDLIHTHAQDDNDGFIEIISLGLLTMRLYSTLLLLLLQIAAETTFVLKFD